MHPNSTRALAKRLMREHGLADWNFRFSSAKITAGSCSYRTRTISLSKPLTSEWSESAVRNTILHEIAHALVGPGHGHNAKWKRQARAIGCTGNRCWAESADSPPVAPTWEARCPNGHVSPRGYHRKPTATRSCGQCAPRRFDPRYVMTYHRVAA